MLMLQGSNVHRFCSVDSLSWMGVRVKGVGVVVGGKPYC